MGPDPNWRYAIPAAALAISLAAAAPAQAGWREDIGTFRIGLVTPDGGQLVEGAELIKQAYSDALGIPVEIFAARDYAALIDAQASKRIDYAVYSSIAYATASKLCSCVVPLASPTTLSGATGVRMILLRRKWVEGAGQPVVAAPPEGALLPRFLLDTARKAVAKDMPFEIRAVSSMEAAERLFVDGKVDALFGWMDEGIGEAAGGTITRLAARGMAETGYEITWKSEPMRFGPHAVRADLAPQAVTLLRNWLLGLKQAKPDVFETLSPQLTGGFALVGADDYRLAGDVVDSLAKGQEAGQ